MEIVGTGQDGVHERPEQGTERSIGIHVAGWTGTGDGGAPHISTADGR